jgi:hypothetical protein
MSAETDESARLEWDRRKSQLMMQILGPEHDHVMHSIVPYAVGGSLDLYYFPNPSGLRGTAIATKELSELPGSGSSNSIFKNYEFVVFSKFPIDFKVAYDDSTVFGRSHRAADFILNRLAPYSAEAVLEPFDTCEVPGEGPETPSQFVIFNAFPDFPTDQIQFGLMAVIRVFQSELEFARANSCRELVERLSDAGVYPYSDLDREPIAWTARRITSK